MGIPCESSAGTDPGKANRFNVLSRRWALRHLVEWPICRLVTKRRQANNRLQDDALRPLRDLPASYVTSPRNCPRRHPWGIFSEGAPVAPRANSLVCPSCGSLVRERALALVLEEIQPNWRDLSIHKSSPASRGISFKLAREAKNYVGSQFFPDLPRGTFRSGTRSEDLQQQTFPDEYFDLVITLDVMEHVFNPDKVYQEVWRTLLPNGYYIHTFPIQKWRVDAFVVRASIDEMGNVIHHTFPEYHGNPIDPKGSLVTYDYGYDVSTRISTWAPFDVRVVRFCDRTHGVLGEFTEVVTCRKRAA